MRRIKFGKCPHWKYCMLYDEGSKVCNEEGGFNGSRYAGCSRRLNDKPKRKK
jgi:hypothetical protein